MVTVSCQTTLIWVNIRKVLLRVFFMSFFLPLNEEAKKKKLSNFEGKSLIERWFRMKDLRLKDASEAGKKFRPKRKFRRFL